MGLNQLKIIFGLGNREAEAIMVDVTSKVYRRRLSQAFSGGELEAAPSKAAFLQNLCDALHFDPHKASEIHEGTRLCLSYYSSSSIYLHFYAVFCTIQCVSYLGHATINFLYLFFSPFDDSGRCS